ncbi:MAG: hypothetical protein NT005_17735 [Spirochaetes bacterium]|nr:hypothetical protein [Spirochaetota bacterium]
MRNRVIVSVLLLVAGAGLVWSQFWKDYGEKDRQTLGESYWLAGRQYETVGKVEKGREHQQLGRLIYPSLDPANIADQELPSAAELLAMGRAKPIGAGAADSSAQALNSFFLRFVGALLDEEAAAVAGFLDSSVYISAIPVEVSRSDAKAQLDGLFASVSLAGYTPSSVYDLDSVVVARAPQGMSAALGEAYILRVDARADFSQYLGFWEKRQQFFIRRGLTGLSIFAIGQNPPPAAWRPQTGEPPVAAREPPAATAAQSSSAIADAFTGCLAAFLAKNADGALAFMAGEVTFLRLRQTVTNDELRTTFLGYFEGTDFADAGVEDVIDSDSIFVEPAESPVDGVAGPVLMLNATARIDLSATIPFLGKYQRYYFLQEAGDWKIFAIL